MRRSLFILATLAMSSALYAQADAGHYNREKVLDIFSQYNPAVLENARQNADYNAVLEGLLASYNAPETEENRYELIALARNFDNSIRLKALAVNYEEAVLFSQMSGLDLSSAVLHFRRELTPVFQNIWAVTVQLREYQIDEYEAQLKELRKNKTLSKETRQAREAVLKEKIKALKTEIKSLKKDAGAQILSAVDVYVAETDRSIAEKLEAERARMQEASSKQVSQTKNLQVKTKNKKPVAK